MTPPAWRPRLVARNALLKAGAHATRALSLGFTILAARALGPEEFGRFTFAYSLTALLGAALDLGMHAVLVRDVSQAPGDAARQWTAGATLKLFMLAPAGGVLGVATWLTQRDQDTMAAMALLGLAFALQAFTELSICVFSAFQRFEFDLLLRTVEKTVLLGAGLLALGRGGGLVAVCGAFALAAAVSAAGGLGLVHLKFTRLPGVLDPAGARALARRLGPFALAYVCDVAKTRMVAPIVFLVAGNAAAGYFGAAARMLDIVMVAPIAVVAAALPALARSAAEHAGVRRPVMQVTEALVLLGLGVALLLPAAGGLLVRHAFGAEYTPASGMLGFLGGAAALAFVNYFLSFVLIAVDRPRRLVTLSVLGLVASLALTPPVVLAAGAEGGAIAVLLLEGFTITAALILVSPVVGLPLGRDTVKAVLAAVLALALARIVPESEWQRAATLLLGYALGLAVLRPACFAQVRRLWSERTADVPERPR